jgi:hypothetical protein
MRDTKGNSNQWEGVTKNTDPGTKLFPVCVFFKTGIKPMYETIRAVSHEQALEFAAARYPGCDIGKTRKASKNAGRSQRKKVPAEKSTVNRKVKKA